MELFVESSFFRVDFYVAYLLLEGRVESLMRALELEARVLSPQLREGRPVRGGADPRDGHGPGRHAERLEDGRELPRAVELRLRTPVNNFEK